MFDGTQGFRNANNSNTLAHTAKVVFGSPKYNVNKLYEGNRY
jgi:hypothetical protein